MPDQTSPLDRIKAAVKPMREHRSYVLAKPDDPTNWDTFDSMISIEHERLERALLCLAEACGLIQSFNGALLSPDNPEVAKQALAKAAGILEGEGK